MKKFSCYCADNNSFTAEVFKTGRSVLFRDKLQFESFLMTSDSLFAFIVHKDSDDLGESSQLVFRLKQAKPHMPVIVVLETWHSSWAEKFFESGADGVSPLEQIKDILFYSVRSLIRTIEAAQVQAKVESQVVELGNLKLDISSRSVFIDNKHINLSGREFLILKLLIDNKERVVKSDFIINSVWRDVAISQGNLHSQIYNLKKKLQGFNGRISTVHRIGLKMEGPYE